MNTYTFKTAMIKYLQQDNEEFIREKYELIKILKCSYINCIPTMIFTRRQWNQHWMNLEIRVHSALLNTARNYEKQLITLCRELYEETEEYALDQVEIKMAIAQIDELEIDIEHKVIFENIQSEIIAEIQNASYNIWIAVAWFTDRDIYNKLIYKKSQGLDIRIITSDEPSNQHLIKELEQFDLVKVPTWGRRESNRLHNKFCIIDLECVMHGSYNWSTNAHNNDETWEISKDKVLAKQFSNQFMKLYKEHKYI